MTVSIAPARTDVPLLDLHIDAQVTADEAREIASQIAAKADDLDLACDVTSCTAHRVTAHYCAHHEDNL